MRRNILWLTILVIAAITMKIESSAQTPGGTSKTDARLETAIRAVIDAQREAWNRGDIEGYMDGYQRSADTVFVSGDNVTHGWQTVFDHYQKGYDSREKMGVLTFSDLEITSLGKNAAVVVGRWHLQRAKDEPHGRFTLILKKTKQGWKIIHDHTSSV
jgi:uncharacterized protein (TIGR02246 family)